MISKKILVVIVGLFLVGLVSADFGYNSLGVPQLPSEFNYSNVNVNHSLTSDYATASGYATNAGTADFWDLLDTPADIFTGDLTDDNTYVEVAGDTMAGDLNLGTNDINNINNVNILNDLDVGDNVEIHGSTWIDEILNVTGITYLYNNLFVDGNITTGYINGFNLTLQNNSWSSDRFYNWTAGAGALDNFATSGSGLFGGTLGVLGSSIGLVNDTDPLILVTDTTNTVSTGFGSQDTLGLMGTTTNHPFYFVTGSVISASIDTSQNWDFQNHNITNIDRVETNQVNANGGDLFMGSASAYINITSTGNIIMKVT